MAKKNNKKVKEEIVKKNQKTGKKVVNERVKKNPKKSAGVKGSGNIISRNFYFTHNIRLLDIIFI